MHYSYKEYYSSKIDVCQWQISIFCFIEGLYVLYIYFDKFIDDFRCGISKLEPEIPYRFHNNDTVDINNVEFEDNIRNLAYEENKK